MKIVIGVLIAVYTLSSHSFNWKKCTSGQSLGTAGIFAPTTSSAQFTTSTGGCAMIGLAPKEQSKLFYAQNFDKLQEDAARGDGEYLQTLAYMNGCAGKRYERLSAHIKNNYKSLMMVDAEKSYSLIEDKLNNCQ